jgi:hypothetical protein
MRSRRASGSRPATRSLMRQVPLTHLTQLTQYSENPSRTCARMYAQHFSENNPSNVSIRQISNGLKRTGKRSPGEVRECPGQGTTATEWHGLKRTGKKEVRVKSVSVRCKMRIGERRSPEPLRQVLLAAGRAADCGVPGGTVTR